MKADCEASQQTVIEKINTTALIDAVLQGDHDALMKLLQEKVDTQATGLIKVDGQLIKEASPIWCAAISGQYAIVKLLDTVGCDINHPTANGSTAIRAACYIGHRDIVHYLIQRNGALHLLTPDNMSCLMLACLKGYEDVARLLIDAGARVNDTSSKGYSPMHYAAREGHARIVELLHEHGCSCVLQNRNGETPIITAALNRRVKVVNYLATCPHISRHRRIEAFELLGASFAHSKKPDSENDVYNYLMRGMRERFEQPDNAIPKEKRKLIPVYGRTECQSIDELEKIKGHRLALLIEGLLVIERIVGETNVMLGELVYKTARVVLHGGHYLLSLNLMLHSMHLNRKLSASNSHVLPFLTTILHVMTSHDAFIKFDCILNVIEMTVSEVEVEHYKILNDKSYVEQSNGYQRLSFNLSVTIYTLIIYLENQTRYTIDERKKVQRIGRRLVLRDCRDEFGATLLHLAVRYTSDLPLQWYKHLFPDKSVLIVQNLNSQYTTPSYPLVQFLLKCSADPGCVNDRKQTPLNIILKHPRLADRPLDTDGIIKILLNYEAQEAKLEYGGLIQMEQNVEPRYPHLCKICVESPIEASLEPCGHFLTCSDCASNLTQCPLCEADIKERMKIHMV